MLTAAAAATADFTRDAAHLVLTRTDLRRAGCSDGQRRARIAAGRWQQIGQAVVLHNGELTRAERWRVATVNCGPRAVLGSFSSAESLGLTGWARDEVHVLAPLGVPAPRLRGLPVVLHRTSRPIEAVRGGTCQPIADALVLAATDFARPRPACGILASGVQQRLVRADDLQRAVARASRGRHHGELQLAIDDIAGGSHALSEIDFARLCRRNRLPAPVQQAVRRQPDGRRRYLDAEWTRADGRRVVVEVDGALHLSARRWWDDQLRQNEIVLSGALVLRYPSVVVRTEQWLVVDQLRRALFG